MQLNNLLSSRFYIVLVLGSLFIHEVELINGLEMLYLAPGYDHICGMFDNNKAKCFGSTECFGVSSPPTIGGNPSEIGNHAPFIEFTTKETITKLVAGGTTTCALLSTGDAKCMGQNYAGQTGVGIANDTVGDANGYIGDSLPTINFGTGLKVLQIGLGYDHACFLLTGNKIKCIGAGGEGAIGYENSNSIGTNSTELGDNLPFVNLGVGVEVSAVHLTPTGEHSCATLSAPPSAARRLKCWGLNNQIQLGFGTRIIGNQVGDMGDNLPLLSFGVESRVKSVSLGYFHTCAQLINDEIRCFGLNTENQLAAALFSVARTASSEYTFAVPVEAGGSIKTFGCGDFTSCFLYDDQLTVKCIGRNKNGELGQGNSIEYSINATLADFDPVDFGTGDLKIKNFYSTGQFSCTEFENKVVKCFGINSSGQFGIGNKDDIGNDPYEMGTNLTASVFFIATNAPTKTPTLPTRSPSEAPTTKTPTKAPSKTPTNKFDTAPANTNGLALSVGLGVSIPIVVIVVGAIIFSMRSRKSNQGNKHKNQSYDPQIAVRNE